MVEIRSEPQVYDAHAIKRCAPCAERFVHISGNDRDSAPRPAERVRAKAEQHYG